MGNDKYENYLHDLGVIFKEKAKEAKRNKNNISGAKEKDYAMGYLMAFHEVIDIMKEQAKVFNIEQKDIGLSDIDAESDLL